MSVSHFANIKRIKNTQSPMMCGFRVLYTSVCMIAFSFLRGEYTKCDAFFVLDRNMSVKHMLVFGQCWLVALYVFDGYKSEQCCANDDDGDGFCCRASV